MSKSTSEGRSIEQKGQRKAKKKDYVSPKLVEYGSLIELTKAGGSGATDAHGFAQN